MDIEIYQLIQQVAEMARQAAIDKAASLEGSAKCI